MTPTPEFLKRELLYEYFFFDATVGETLTREGRREIFLRMAEIFTVTDEGFLERTFAAAEHELARPINTLREMERLLRCAELYGSVYQPLSAILSFKYRALQRREPVFEHDSPFEIEYMLYALEKAAAEGYTAAATLLGFLTLEGYLSDTEREENTERLLHAVAWNSPMALLLAIVHFPERKEELASRLCALLSHRGEKEVYEYLKEIYALPEASDAPAVTALEKAFEAKRLDREKIGASTLRILSSTVLTERSKCALLAQDPASYPISLPLNVNRKSAPFTKTKLSPALFARERADMLIENNLLYRGSRRGRPLLIVCPENILLREYERRLREAYADRAFCSVDLASCGDAHIENLMLRALDGAGENGPLFIFKGCESLSENGAEVLYRLLKGDIANQYMTESGYAIDLSSVVSVLFTREKPHAGLAAICDIVMVESIKAEEKESAMDKLLAENASSFGLASLTLTPEARDTLLHRSENAVEALIEHAIRSYFAGGDSFTIGKEMLDGSGVFEKTKIGIWGGTGTQFI